MKSFQVPIPSAGTAEQGPDEIVQAGAYVYGLSTNTGSCYVNDAEGNLDGGGDLSGNSAELKNSGNPFFVTCTNLKELYFDADNNDDVVCILKV